MTLNLRQLSCITADITPDQGTVNLGESDGGGDDDGGGSVGWREVAGGPLNSLPVSFFFFFSFSSSFVGPSIPFIILTYFLFVRYSVILNRRL